MTGTARNWQSLLEEVHDDRRKGVRVGIIYPVTIRGISEGQYFAEETRTLNVSEEGCCFESKHRLQKGDVVSLEVRRRVHLGPKTFQVVHVERRDELWIAGALLMETGDVWGISFPQRKNKTPSGTR